ncbi:MAG: protein-disulfide reductase DsbD domain-containing protein [Pseudomonadota bacterium]
MQRLFRATLLAALAAAAPAAAQQPFSGKPEDIVRAEFIGGWRMADGTRMAALKVRLAEGWKTYWRAPGDTGIPPRFDWAGSQNVASVAFRWPQPEVFDVSGLRIVGYRRELVLPFAVIPQDPGAPVRLMARVELGVCETVCVPVNLDVSADLPSGTGPDPEIVAALARMPVPGAQAGLSAATCTTEPIADGIRLTAKVEIPAVGQDEFAVIELADPAIWISQAEVERRGPSLTAVSDLVPPEARPFPLDPSQVRITLLGGGRAVEIEGCTG